MEIEGTIAEEEGETFFLQLEAALVEMRSRGALSATLGWDNTLAQLAAIHAGYLAERGILSHRDAQGRRAAQRLAVLFPQDLFERAPVTLGEVLALGRNAREIVEAWNQSDSHRRIILDPRWTQWAWALAPWRENDRVVVLLFR